MTMTATAAPAGPPAQALPQVPDPPYPGIRPFEEREWPVFFGRQKIVEELLERLSRERFVAVVGASGGGKSSLIKAGLFATLKHKHARLGVVWRTAEMRPAGSPMWSLAEALYLALHPLRAGPHTRRPPVEVVTPLRAGLARGPHAIAAVLEDQGFPAEHNLLLLVDQFEELFRYDTLGGEREIRTFLDQLLDVVDRPPQGFYLALTMRSDFLGHCARYPRLAEALNRSAYLLRRMSEAELSDAILYPAALLDGRIAPNLTHRLIRDAQGEQDHLPLLQHALMWLWVREQRQREEGATPDAALELDLDDYQAVGGMAGALSQHANSIYERLGDPDATSERRQALQLATKRLFQTLAEPGESGLIVRRPRQLVQIRDETGVPLDDLREIIEAFRAPGRSFLMPPFPRPLTEDAVIDVGHEALIRQWDKLQGPEGWLREEQADAEAWGRLCARSHTYLRTGRLLVADETEELGAFWRRQQPSPAWVRRYTASQDPLPGTATDADPIAILHAKAQELIEQSRASLAEEARRREEERREAERLRLEAAESERKAKHSRQLARRTAVFMVVALGLAGLAGWQWFAAETARERAEAAQEVAEAAQKKERAARELESLRRANVENQFAQLQQVIAKLQATAANAAPDSQVYEGIAQATEQVQQVQQALLPPRVYIHITEEAQRDGAGALEARLEQIRIGTDAVIVPGIELVKEFSGESVLRCFRADECQNDGPQLVDAINKLLATPKVALEDLSGTYGQSTDIRPRHFELWFGPGAIRVGSVAN